MFSVLLLAAKIRHDKFELGHVLHKTRVENQVELLASFFGGNKRWIDADQIAWLASVDDFLRPMVMSEPDFVFAGNFADRRMVLDRLESHGRVHTMSELKFGSRPLAAWGLNVHREVLAVLNARGPIDNGNIRQAMIFVVVNADVRAVKIDHRRQERRMSVAENTVGVRRVRGQLKLKNVFLHRFFIDFLRNNSGAGSRDRLSVLMNVGWRRVVVADGRIGGRRRHGRGAATQATVQRTRRKFTEF